MWSGRERPKPTRRGSTKFSTNFSCGCLVTLYQGYAPSLSYENLLHHFRLPSLSSRRMQHDIIFIRNIFRLNIDSADLLASFALHIPTRSTRAYKLFNEPRARVNTVQSSLFCRLPRVANSFLNKCNRVDVFNDTFHAFKRAVIRYVNELWLAMQWPTNFSIYPTSPISGVFPVGDWMNKWKMKTNEPQKAF